MGWQWGTFWRALVVGTLLLLAWKWYALEIKVAELRPAPVVTPSYTDLEVLQRQMDSLRGIVHDLARRDITPVNITAKSCTIFNSNGTLSVQVKEEEEKSGVSTMQVPFERKGGNK